MPNKRTYQYGSDPKHTIELTEIEAHAVNNLRIYGFDEATGTVRCNADEVDIEAYNRAAPKLNGYIQRNGGSIPCTEEYLEDHEILTLVK